MSSRTGITLSLGAVCGVLFFLCALLPRSYLFPAVWPLVGGALAVYRANKAVGTIKWRERLLLAADVGLIAGVVFMLLGTSFLYRSAGGTMPRALRTLGRDVFSSVDTYLIVNTAIIASFVIPIAALLGGVFAYHLHHAFRRHRNA